MSSDGFNEAACLRPVRAHDEMASRELVVHLLEIKSAVLA
jgi:hypothetical protein